MASDPIQEVERLASRLLDQQLSPDEAGQLNSLVLESPQARKRYQELLDNHEALCAIYPGDVYGSSINDGLAEVDATEMPAREAQPRWRAWLTWAAVAAAVVSAVGIFMGRPSPSQVPKPSSARLVATVDVVWQGEPGANHRGDPLHSDAVLEVGGFALAAGTVELELDDGARVTIQGPAKFELKSGSHIYLQAGNLVARIPEEALGFVVTTPEAEVVDLGTEFGLSVDENGGTDVHVLDGLVQVLRGEAEGIKISEGDARRLDERGVNGIQLATREALLESHRMDRYGLALLRGAVRVREDLNFEARPSGQHWIDVVPERRGVSLERPLEVMIDAPGVYRSFKEPNGTVPAGIRVDSYLLHFRPTKTDPARGVIKFSGPIVAVIGRTIQLESTDRGFGLGTLRYPDETWRFRGLESLGSQTKDETPYSVSDEVTLSQDRRTISLTMRANIEEGIDQVRVLTLSEEVEE